METATLIETGKRIIGYELTNEPVLASKPGASPCQSASDFLRNEVERKGTLLRVYAVEGLSTKIVAPDTYAKQLDVVRRFRLGLEGTQIGSTHSLEPGLLHRALPEDFIAHLDALPNHRLIERLYLMNESNPMDPFHQKATGDPNFESQASTADNAVTFYKKNVDPYLGDELRHEWSHLARQELPTESSGFDLAAKHEGKNYIPRERARTDPEEYWSVLLGEEMLNPDAARFFVLTQQAPLQSVMLALSLLRIMESEVTSSAGKLQTAEVRVRIKYVQDAIRPQAMNKLMSEVRDGHGEGIANTAARLLIRLDEGHRLSEIPTLKSLDLSGDPVGATSLTQLKSNRNVEDLNLSRTYAGASGFAYLEGMPLKTLSLAGTRTPGSSLRSLEPVRTLERLDLSFTDVNDNGLSSLRRMPNLKRIDLRGASVTPEGVNWLRQQMPRTEIEF